MVSAGRNVLVELLQSSQLMTNRQIERFNVAESCFGRWFFVCFLFVGVLEHLAGGIITLCVVTDDPQQCVQFV
jgi:hypothetical protein